MTGFDVCPRPAKMWPQSKPMTGLMSAPDQQKCGVNLNLLQGLTSASDQ